MAMPITRDAQVIGNAFVQQYYYILHQSPELVFKFYTDSSVLSRPGLDGVMTSVTTMDAINEKIISLEYKECKAKIRTIDPQASHKEGVMVLVTGSLTWKNHLTRNFTQSFFLAPQEKGYFVLNDIFRYVDEHDLPEATPVTDIAISESVTSAPVTSDPESAHVSDRSLVEAAPSVEEGSLDYGKEVCRPLEVEEGSVVDIEDVAEPPAQLRQNEVRLSSDPDLEAASSVIPEDTPKKSYASIVKVSKGKPLPSTPIQKKTVPTAVYVPTTSAKVAPGNSEQQYASTPAPEASSPGGNSLTESSTNNVEVEGYSIYIRSLPMNATIKQVEEEFKKFGPIKPYGIQVRINKQQGYCYGFVEFESLSSMHSALEVSSVIIGGRQVYIEEKKTTSRAGSGRGRFPPSSSGPSNENFRGRGNFNSGRGYGRNDFGYRGDFSGRGRGRGSSGRSGENYQRVSQSGRVVRQSETNEATVSV